jgi:spore coat protein H
MRRKWSALIVISFMLFGACSTNDITPGDGEITELPQEDTDFSPNDWTEATHSKSADPNFAEVFDNSAVKRLDIVVSQERWQSMLDDMTSMYGSFGGIGGNRPPGIAAVSDEDPIFVPADVYYNDLQWYRVGIRFKGNSSLQSSWQQGILKLSFKLDFDEFEDDYPQIENQRFYGFKKLSLKNNYDDDSFLREKVASEVFANSGLAMSHTAFYTLYVDYGDGPLYFGLYTLVEEVDDTVIETQFSDDDGNLYKPEDEGASFASGTFNESDFEKKTNEDESDWSDIQSLFSVLHDDSRINDPGAWRARLEKVFDTEVFLKYLAVNTVIQNWDTYGRMTHNYYLYNNPGNGKLTWIPWDNNEALQTGKQGGALALDFSDLQSGKWPLIEYLYDDEVYRFMYDAFVRETIEGPFNVASVQSVYDNYAALIEPYATTEVPGYTFLNSSSSFAQEIVALKQHATTRTKAADNYLK